MAWITAPAEQPSLGIGDTMSELIFLGAAFLIGYAYIGYPITLGLLASLRSRPPFSTGAALPTVSLIVPVHNELANIEAKIANNASLEYPSERLEVIYVSDGSTDGTDEYLAAHAGSRARVLRLPTRSGKGAALNAALAAAKNEIVVFTDASILLAPDALRHLVRPFQAADIGCVSGEDRIAGSAGGEAIYGRYELMLRRYEGRLGSIVGASGSFYAQRRALCAPFLPNLAPDFLSVLRTVEQGFRAVSEPTASGTMPAVRRTSDEFQRKVRTLLRGITTLVEFAHLLNPVKYGVFSLELLAHKGLRWSVPFLMLSCVAANVVLAARSPVYAAVLVIHLAFYATAVVGLAGPAALRRSLPARVAAYLIVSNAAVLVAWWKYVTGIRQEVWSPSQREQDGPYVAR